MSAVDVHFDTRELEQAIGAISEQTLSVALPIIAETMVSAVDELIQSEGATGERGAWQPFSPNTFKIHPRRRGGKLLQDTGLLADIQTEFGSDFVDIMSPAPYAVYQQEGVYPNPWFGFDPIPPRDFLAIKMEEVLEEAAELILVEAVG